MRSFCILIIGIAAMCMSVPSSACTRKPSAFGAEYQQAIELVRAHPKVQRFVKQLPTHVNAAFADFRDEEVRYHGRCYWSVSVYEDHDDTTPGYLTRWNSFLVDVKRQKILVEDFEGKPHAVDSGWKW